MRLLLDTHALIWLMQGSQRLKPSARAVIDAASEVYVSSITILEIAIKHKLGKIEEDPEKIVENFEEAGLKELYVSNRHSIASGKLPLLHRDPFDRLLVAQAMTEPMHLLTADARLPAYSELVILI